MGRSTSNNLLYLTSYVTAYMLKRDQTDAVFTDLTTAYEKLNHRIAKLNKLKINGDFVLWPYSYLIACELAVIIGYCQFDFLKPLLASHRMQCTDR